MRFEFDYPAEVWSIMPLVGSGGEAEWVDEQLALARADYPSRLTDAENRAWHALGLRRDGIQTSLYFRPPALPTSAVLHITVGDAAIDDDAFVADDWIPDDVHPGIPATVFEFETDHSPHGFRVAYVSQAVAPDGSALAGITYGLRFDDGVCAVFSEPADRETVGLLQIGADPLISSLRLVP